MQGKGKFLDDTPQNPPLSFEELRARLKHIAGLCWGLSIDLANEIQLRKETESKIAKAETKIAELNGLLDTYRRKEYDAHYRKTRKKK